MEAAQEHSTNLQNSGENSNVFSEKDGFSPEIKVVGGGEKQVNVGVNIDPSAFEVNGLSVSGMAPWMADYAQSVACDYCVPLDYVVGSMAGAISIAAGGGFCHQSMYLNTPCIWVGIVGISGDGKSEMMKKIFEPIKNIDTRLCKEYKKSVREWESKGGKEEKPKSLHLLENPKNTPEVMLQGLCENKHGLILLSGEMGSIMSNVCKYSPGGTVAEAWCEWWDGKNVSGALRRVTKDPIDTPHHMHFSIIGGIQPELIKEELMSKRMMDLGFAHRWLWIFPNVREARPYNPSQPTDNTQWVDYINHLYSCSATTNHLQWCTEAVRLYSEFHDELEEERISGDKYTAGRVSKIETNYHRWVIVRHLMTDPETEVISEDTAREAIADMRCFKRWAEDLTNYDEAKTDGKKELSQREVYRYLKTVFPDMNQSALAKALCPNDEQKSGNLRTSISRALK